MAIGERIEIKEYWEAQLCQRSDDGVPIKIGEPKRSFKPGGHFEEGRFEVDPDSRYAVKSRKVTLDDEGHPTYGEWEWVTKWERPIIPEKDD